MNVLIIGNGGREHALAWKVAQSARVEHIYVAPGNAGTALENKVSNVDIAVDDIRKTAEEIVAYVHENARDLVARMDQVRDLTDADIDELGKAVDAYKAGRQK